MTCCLNINNFNQVSLTCEKVSPQWAKLAKYLNIDVTVVESIDVRGRDTVWCLDELLKVWLRGSSISQSSQTWRILCDAVAKMNKPLSEEIWSNHTKECDLCRDHNSHPYTDSPSTNSKEKEIHQLMGQVELLKKMLKQKDEETQKNIQELQGNLKQKEQIIKERYDKTIKQKDEQLQQTIKKYEDIIKQKDVQLSQQQTLINKLQNHTYPWIIQDEQEVDLTQNLELARGSYGQDDVIKQKEKEIQDTIRWKDDVIHKKEEEIRIKNSEIQSKIDIIRQKDDWLQQNHCQIQHLQSQLESRLWVIQDEEVDVTNTIIGGGAYGEVRVAVFRGARVAAKLLHELIVSDYNKDVFTREMEISSGIHHPNIVQFIGATRINNPILLYELMPTSLHKRLQAGSPLTHAQIVSIGCDICTAMCYLHQWRPQAIIHRDISSPNVLMEPLPNDKWRAKLSDFGSANLQMHIKTVIPGNPAYAAPEALIPQHHSPAMDVYSLGVLLTEMTLHRVPEMDSTRREQSAHGIDWEEMRAIVLKCINNDRSQRLSSVQLLTVLQKL